MNSTEKEDLIRRVTAEVVRSLSPLLNSSSRIENLGNHGSGSCSCANGDRKSSNSSCCVSAGDSSREPGPVPSLTFEDRLLSEEKLLALAGRTSCIRITRRTLVTPLAVDRARELGIEIRSDSPRPAVVSGPTAEGVGFYSDRLNASFERLIRGISDALPVKIVKVGFEAEGEKSRRTSPLELAAACARGVVEGKYRRAVILHEDAYPLLRRLRRIKGVRAGLCSDLETAVTGRRERDENVLLLSSRSLGLTMAGRLVRAWLGEEES